MKKGLTRLILGVLLFLVGTFVIPASVILPVIFGHSEEHRFLVPGEKEVMLSEPGRYYLWNHFQAIYEGQSYRRSKHLPDGVKILIETVDGKELPLHEATSFSVTNGGSARQSIGYFEIQEPGQVIISISGESEEHVVSVSEFHLAEMLWFLLAGFTLAMVVALAGIALAVWGIVNLARRNGADERSA